MTKFQDCRCNRCNKLLGKVGGDVEVVYVQIVCVRCKVLNTFNLTSEQDELRHS